MPSLNHLHTYKKFGRNKNVYQCMDPYCTHIINKALINGKAAICSGCSAEFILTNESLKRSFPKCINCMNTKASKEYKAKKAILEAIGLGASPENSNE